MIRIRDLDFSYGDGDFRLRVPELHLERGSRAALVGPSGSGKTTLLNLIAGIALPDRGHVRTDGVELNGRSDAARRSFRITRIGLIFQEFELLDYLSVLDNILLPYRINAALGLDAEVRERATELARSVGIGDKLGRHPDHLSQGERQRVAVCRALLPRPPLLLADEPTGNLDPANAERVLRILFDYLDGHDATLLAVTHDHALLPRFEQVIDCRELIGLPEVPRAASGGAAPS